MRFRLRERKKKDESFRVLRAPATTIAALIAGAALPSRRHPTRRLRNAYICLEQCEIFIGQPDAKLQRAKTFLDYFGFAVASAIEPLKK